VYVAIISIIPRLNASMIEQKKKSIAGVDMFCPQVVALQNISSRDNGALLLWQPMYRYLLGALTVRSICRRRGAGGAAIEPDLRAGTADRNWKK